MPQFNVKVRLPNEPGVHKVSVWADNQRQANLQAVVVAKKLLGPLVELV